MHVTLRFTRHILLTSLIIGGLSILIAGLSLYGSLPQYDGEIEASGLSAPVTIERDALGSVTLTGANRLDLAQALGYVHAQERFFEMDLMRRQAAGELSELLGSATLAHDRKARAFRMRARAALTARQLPETQRQWLDAYRTGVNQGIAALPVRPFPYLLTQTRPTAWRNEDSILVIAAMFFILNETNIYRELGLSSMHAALPASAFRFLTASAGTWDAPLIDDPITLPPLPSVEEIDLQALNERLFQDRSLPSEQAPGSNSFAVSGTLSGGSAMVANDMHLALRVPNLWFRSRLIYPDTTAPGQFHDITGVSLPGVPAIVVGSNRHIAWSFTNSHADFADWVRIAIDETDATRYLKSSGWQSLAAFTETIRVRNAPDETISIRETEWGPILAHDHDKTPLALAWIALRPEAINLTLIELESIKTAIEAIKAAPQFGIPVQNFIVGDRDGNIGWTLAGRIPVRSGNYNPQIPADWTLPGTGWNGWLEPAHYPAILNPDSQRLWSANSRLVSGQLLNLLGNGGYDLGARALQIRDGLFSHDRLTAQDMQAIQLDHRALLLTRWHRLLQSTLASMDNDRLPWIAAMESALGDWNGAASTDSISYRIVRTFRHEVTQTVLNGFAAQVRQIDAAFKLPRLSQAEWIVWQLIENKPQHLLPATFNNWEELLLVSAQRIAEEMQQNGGIATRNWGETNAARIRHPLSHKMPVWIARWLDMPQDPLPGDHNVPRVQSPDFGASQRSVVAPGQEEHGIFDMPGGQSGHPLSPYYGSGHANWVSGKPTPFLPGNTERQMRLVPTY